MRCCSSSWGIWVKASVICLRCSSGTVNSRRAIEYRSLSQSWSRWMNLGACATSLRCGSNGASQWPTWRKNGNRLSALNVCKLTSAPSLNILNICCALSEIVFRVSLLKFKAMSGSSMFISSVSNPSRLRSCAALMRAGNISFSIFFRSCSDSW